MSGTGSKAGAPGWKRSLCTGVGGLGKAFRQGNLGSTLSDLGNFDEKERASLKALHGKAPSL